MHDGCARANPDAVEPAKGPQMATGTPTSMTAAAARGWAKLLVACGAIGLLFGVVFPAWMRRPEVHRHWERLQRQGIDPAAMYYTELEMMAGLLRQLERRAHTVPFTKRRDHGASGQQASFMAEQAGPGRSVRGAKPASGG